MGAICVCYTCVKKKKPVLIYGSFIQFSFVVRMTCLPKQVFFFFLCGHTRDNYKNDYYAFK